MSSGNPKDSYAPLLLSILFSQQEKEPDLVVQAHKYLRSFELDSANAKAFTGKLVLFDNEGDYIESTLLAVPPARRLIKIQWGWDTGKGLLAYPIYSARSIRWTSVFNEQGAELEIELMAVELESAITDKKELSYAKNDKSVSDIVRDIAAKFGWSHTDRRGRETIEDSVDTANAPIKLPEPISNYSESPVGLIRQKIVEAGLARNKDGEPFDFYVTKDAVHFHSKSFLLKNNNNRVVASYTFARDMLGEVISFAPENTVLFSHLQGGENATYTFFDERVGRRVEIKTTKDGGPDGLIVSYPDEKTQQSTGDGTKARIIIPARSEAEGRHMVQYTYAKGRSVAYAATLVVRGTHAVEVGDFIDVRYFVKRDVPHYLSGTFHVLGVAHSVNAGSWTTTFRLLRSGQNQTEEQDKAGTISADKKIPVMGVEPLQSRFESQAKGIETSFKLSKPVEKK